MCDEAELHERITRAFNSVHCSMSNSVAKIGLSYKCMYCDKLLYREVKAKSESKMDDPTSPDSESSSSIFTERETSRSEQSEILTFNQLYKIIENPLASVGASCYDPSRIPLSRSAPKLFTSTIPGGFYGEY
ncbi:hypothetical protein TNCV_4739941 [Trichonephila clavipes]|nr:hypothetical protein TNCV_4739941 [Trichonephila clavipes]